MSVFKMTNINELNEKQKAAAELIRKRLKQVLILMYYVCLMAVAGLYILAFAYKIPADRMRQQIVESTEQFEVEPHPYSFSANPVDNLTDGYMLLAAGRDNTDNIWLSAVNIWIDGYEEKMPNQALVEIYKYEQEPDSSFSYSRYWHGYLIFLKPVLCFFNYAQIRYLMSALQLIMLYVTTFFIQKKMGGWYALPLIVAYIFMNPVSTMSCMQYNVVTIITLISLVSVVRRLDYWLLHDFATCLLFCTIGLCTSYFDLLTFPLLTLGAPLVTLMSYRIFRQREDNLLQLFHYIVSWCIGYFGMWIMKWVYGSIITRRNLFRDAIDQAKFRTSSYDPFASQQITYQDVVRANMEQISIVSLIVAAVVFLVIIFVKPNSRPRRGAEMIACFLAVALLPFAWYFLLKNHSYVHSWFTFRNLSVTVYSVLMCAVTWRGFFDKFVFTADGSMET